MSSAQQSERTYYLHWELQTKSAFFMLLLLLQIPKRLPDDSIQIRVKINRDVSTLSELSDFIKAFNEIRPGVTLIKCSVASPPILEILSDYHWLVEFIATISGVIAFTFSGSVSLIKPLIISSENHLPRGNLSFFITVTNPACSFKLASA